MLTADNLVAFVPTHDVNKARAFCQACYRSRILAPR